MTASCHVRTSWMWRPGQGCHAGTPSLPTAGFLPLPAFDAKIHLQPVSRMIGRMTRAFGADDVAPSPRSSENYVFR